MSVSIIAKNCLLEARRFPQAGCKSRVLDLEAIIHTHCLAAFRLPGGGLQRQRPKKSHVVAAEAFGEEQGYRCDFGGQRVWLGE